MQTSVCKLKDFHEDLEVMNFSRSPTIILAETNPENTYMAYATDHNCLVATARMHRPADCSTCWETQIYKHLQDVIPEHSDAYYISLVNVASTHRNRGICQSLIQLLRSECTTTVLLEVERNNDPAIRAYEKSGFLICKSYEWGKYSCHMMIA
jgi:ribosomal protein S18 acetylase RimI-like enzyme